MPNFSEQSENKLKTCHPDLIMICRFVIEIFDYTVLCGWRDKEEQDKAYPKYSNIKFPFSKHNNINKNGDPQSLAIDVIPYDSIKRKIVSWDADKEFCLMAGFFKMSAYALNIPIRWGHDWNNNNLMWDEVGKLKDMPHFELLSKEEH